MFFEEQKDGLFYLKVGWTLSRIFKFFKVVFSILTITFLIKIHVTAHTVSLISDSLLLQHCTVFFFVPLTYFQTCQKMCYFLIIFQFLFSVSSREWECSFTSLRWLLKTHSPSILWWRRKNMYFPLSSSSTFTPKNNNNYNRNYNFSVK